jgi:protein-disulfide isomerase
MAKPKSRGGSRPTGGSTASRASARRQAEFAAQAAQRRRDRRRLAAAVGALVLLLVLGGVALQAWRGSRTPTAVPGVAASPTPASLADGRPVVFGSPQAPVTLTLWADFHCPACIRFEEQHGPALLAAQQRGQLKQELYPMSFRDPGSDAAAAGFACAVEAGFGQSYGAGLFANADLEWNDKQLLALAGQVSPTVPDGFAGCVTERRHQGWVDSIDAAADAAGVTGTPTVLLNGAALDLAGLTPDRLTALIDEADPR